MGIFTDNYKKLLIIQYSNKPKAQSTIESILKQTEKVYELANSFNKALDLDFAGGKQLDILGKIVGLNRKIPFAVPKKYFGFSDYDYSYPFGEKFENVVAYPFRNKFEPPYTALELNDINYRFLLRAKISKNYAKATMIDDKKLSIQDIAGYLFNGKAFVIDNFDMSMSLYADNTYDFNNIRLMIQLQLLPKPQAVKIRELVAYDTRGTFGFKDNPNSKGFGDKNGDKIDSYFAIREHL